MFDHVSLAPPDSILGLGEAFLNDPRNEKINLTVGVFKDERLNTPILRCVKEAERRLIANESTKSYLGIDGMPTFREGVGRLVFGDRYFPERTAILQTPGGTGALRVASEFLAEQFPDSRIFVPQPTWANHQSIFRSAGFEVGSLPYLSQQTLTLDFEGLVHGLETEAKAGDVICLHACCHNPTGVDPTVEQWAKIAQIIADRKLLPFFDFAYQGFGEGLEEDCAGLNAVLDRCEEVVVCSSYSKNFGLYSERVGAVMVRSTCDETSKSVLSQLKKTVRSNYSNPPRHGAAIVASILDDEALRNEWIAEVNTMRDRIAAMRHQFVSGMKATGVDRSFEFLLGQKGMFSYTGLNPMQADWLRNERAIYMVGTGRINVAGITPSNMEYLCDSIATCLESTVPSAP